MWDFIFRNEGDMLIGWESDTYVLSANLQAIVKEFEGRPELLCAPRWWKWVDQNFFIMKREGVLRYLHGRLRANLIAPGTKPEPMLAEHEWAEIFHGSWWNPWPNVASIRQDHGIQDTKDVEAAAWPLVRRPSPSLLDAIGQV
jgi:hypothetical protein